MYRLGLSQPNKSVLVDTSETSPEHVVLLNDCAECLALNPIVLQIFQADGSTESFQLQPGANQLIPQATDRYRVSNVEGDLPPEEAGGQWAPTVWRDGTDLIIDSPRASTTLTIKEYFAVCDEAGECPVEIAPAGASSVVVDPATLPLQTIADGRSLLADFSPLAELSEPSLGVGSYVLGGLGAVAVIGLMAGAVSDNEDSGDAAADDAPTIDQIDGTPESIRVAGDNVSDVSLEGGDQIVSASEASSDEERFEIVLTLSDDVTEVDRVRLYWDFGAEKEYVEVSDTNFTWDRIESDNTVVIGLRLDQRQGPGGTTIEVDDLLELDIVLVGDNPNNAEVPSSRVDIQLDVQIQQGGDPAVSLASPLGDSLLPNDSILPLA